MFGLAQGKQSEQFEAAIRAKILAMFCSNVSAFFGTFTPKRPTFCPVPHPSDERVAEQEKEPVTGQNWDQPVKPVQLGLLFFCCWFRYCRRLGQCRARWEEGNDAASDECRSRAPPPPHCHQLEVLVHLLLLFVLFIGSRPSELVHSIAHQ
jgi:hypothetical protein